MSEIESSNQIAIESEIKEQVQKYLDYFNEALPDSMELEFEGFYRRGFFVSKKRYAVIENGTIIAKGLELVRRDWAPVAKNTQEEILMSILKEGDVKKAEKIIKNVLKRIKKGEINNEELIIHTQITKKLTDYKQIGPHVLVARQLEAHGKKVGKGTIVQYIISKGKGSISERAIPYEYCEGIEYDKDYYIHNQVIPAVSRMMEPLGYTKKQLIELGEGERQQSLDDFF